VAIKMMKYFESTSRTGLEKIREEVRKACIPGISFSFYAYPTMKKRVH